MMKKPRKKKGYRSVFRELMLLSLYQWEFRKENEDIESIIDGFIKNKKHRFIKALKERAKEIVELKDEIDAILKKYSHWPYDRIDLVDKIIMRIAVFEMLYKGVPPEIAISEAIKLSRKFSTANSYKLINGILERVKEEVVEAAS